MGSAKGNPSMVYKFLAINNRSSSSTITGNYLLARVTLLCIRLREIHRSIFEQWEIKSIQPDYRVLPFVPVVMPMP
jgi:hypothetical protein